MHLPWNILQTLLVTYDTAIPLTLCKLSSQCMRYVAILDLHWCCYESGFQSKTGESQFAAPSVMSQKIELKRNEYTMNSIQATVARSRRFGNLNFQSIAITPGTEYFISCRVGLKELGKRLDWSLMYGAWAHVEMISLPVFRFHCTSVFQIK